MPVKVRCTSCGTILNAPDRARGKAVKCPECETKIRVPAAKSTTQQAAAKKQAGAKKPLSSTMLIANLDLDSLEDTDSRVCPRCGTEVSSDDFDCPNCGVDLETGELSEKQRRLRQRKGPDPRHYYATLRSDAWTFLKENRSLAMRTSIYSVVFSIVTFFCIYMALSCKTWPPRTLWWFIAVVTGLIPAGWTWFLHSTIINATLSKKLKLKKVNFDFFQSTALGLKLILWFLAIGAPFYLIAGVVALLGMPVIVPLVFVGLALLLAQLMFPVAMVHMSMPVTYRGWLLTSLFPSFAKTAAPALYWLLFFGITMFPFAALVGAVGGISGQDIYNFGVAQRHNADVEYARTYQESTGLVPTPEIEAIASQEYRDPHSVRLILPAALWLVACMVFGFTAVFNMRTNGQFAFYFKPALDLIELEKQATYVPKSESDEEEPEQPSNVSLGMILAALSVVATILWGYQMEATIGGLIAAVIQLVALWIPIIALWRMFEMARQPGPAALAPFVNVWFGIRAASKKGQYGALVLSIWVLLMQGVMPILFWVLIIAQILFQAAAEQGPPG